MLLDFTHLFIPKINVENPITSTTTMNNWTINQLTNSKRLSFAPFLGDLDPKRTHFEGICHEVILHCSPD